MDTHDMLVPARTTVVDWLVQRRHRLALGYFFLTGSLLVAGTIWGPEVYAYGPTALVTGSLKKTEHLGSASLLVRALLAFGFLATQAIFILGAGRVRAAPRPGGRLPAILLSAVAGGAVALATYAAYALVVDLLVVDDDRTLMGPKLGRNLILCFWAAWALIFLVYVRRIKPTPEVPDVDRAFTRAMNRLVCTLIAASWIDFFVALAAQSNIRRDKENCICFTGSWVALILAVPLLVWSFGPGLMILYWHRKRAPETDLLPILRAKTRWVRRRRPVKVETGEQAR